MHGSPCQPAACLYGARVAVLSLLQQAGVMLRDDENPG